MPRLLLTVEEAADRIGICRSNMFKLIRQGDVKSVKVGRLRRITPAALEDFIRRAGLFRGCGSLMPRTKTSRQSNLRSSIYQGEDGYWHGRVTVGVRDDGTPDRRHVMSKDKAKVTAKVRQLERQRDDGIIIRPGRAWTVERWLTHWLENIARPSVRYKPYIGYRTAVNRHLIPGLGAHRIDRIQPEHFEKLYTRMLTSGLKPATAHQVHRTARTAFGEAFKRGYIARNPVALAKPPRVEDREVDPFEAEEIERILALALTQAQRGPVRYRARARTAARRGARAEMVTAARAQQDAGDHAGPATADMAARLRRSSCLRCPLPQDQAVPEELQAAPAGMPAAVPAGLHQPCPLVPRSPRWRPR